MDCDLILTNKLYKCMYKNINLTFTRTLQNIVCWMLAVIDQNLIVLLRFLYIKEINDENCTHNGRNVT